MGELSERQAFLVLNGLPDMGPITLNRLLAELGGDPRAVLEAPIERLGSVEGVRAAAAGSIRSWRKHFDLAREEDRMAKGRVTFITTRDAAYPRLLREIHDPPIGLYRRGGYEFARRSIAIVGSRRTTIYGVATARRLAAELTRIGFTIVSGLARGIDTAAHEGALDAGGPTVAVLGTGIDTIYPPENLDLYRRIETTGGAIISEFPFGRPADKQSFAMRNRIVSGICEAVIVVESAVSGGAMITARFAGEQGRELFAVPGRIDQPSSGGCHQLIRDGATLLSSVDDVLNELNYLEGMRPAIVGSKQVAEPVGVSNLNDDERGLLECFTGGEIAGPDRLVEQTGLPAPRVAAALMMLELKRLVAKRTDGAYEARN